MRPNPRVAAVASSQLGLISMRQALCAGMTEHEVRWLLRTGLWEHVHAGVYRLSGMPRSWRQDVLAACLVADGPVMASHRAAAVMWDLADRDLEVVEITVPRGNRPVPRGVVVHRLRDFRAQDLSLRDGIPVSNPLRTILDLGAVAPNAVRHAVDVATSRRLVSVAGLWTIVNETGRKGRTGV